MRKAFGVLFLIASAFLAIDFALAIWSVVGGGVVPGEYGKIYIAAAAAWAIGFFWLGRRLLRKRQSEARTSSGALKERIEPRF